VTLRGAQILARGREAANGEGREFDWAQAADPKAIRLSSNENPVGPPRVAVDALIAALSEAPRYPSGSTQQAATRVAAFHSVPVDSVVLGCGSGEILRMAVYAWVGPGRPLVTALPTFEDPTRCAEVMGAPVIAVPVTQALKLDLDTMAERARGAGLVFLCNPNNPTATVHGAKAITDFVERVHRTSPDTTVLIDEAYHEYVEDPSYATALPLALERPRVQTAHFYGSFWPHDAGFNQLNVEAAIPDAVYNELKARGHDVSRLRQFGMSGCATAVLIDPASGNRIAGADPRRDCYAIAY